MTELINHDFSVATLGLHFEQSLQLLVQQAGQRSPATLQDAPSVWAVGSGCLGTSEPSAPYEKLAENANAAVTTRNFKDFMLISLESSHRFDYCH